MINIAHDLIIVSAITERRHMIDEYEDKLAAAGIDFHLEKVELPYGIASMTARWRFAFIRRMCEKFSGYERIIFTDAWDVLFFGTKEELISKIPKYPLVSAERNCWPEENIADRFTSESPWRFCNAGMICGSPESILVWLGWAIQCPYLDLMDQAWFNRRFSEGHPNINLDEATSIFYTVSYDREDGTLQMKDGRPWNSRFGTFPMFFHFAGPCSSVPFRAMLRTGKPLCVSVQ